MTQIMGSEARVVALSRGHHCRPAWDRGSPGPRAPAGIARAIDESLRGSGIGVGLCRLTDTGGHPRLRLIRHIAEKFHLDFIWRVEPIGCAIGLVEGAERVSADAVEVKIVPTGGRAVPERPRPMAARYALIASARTILDGCCVTSRNTSWSLLGCRRYASPATALAWSMAGSRPQESPRRRRYPWRGGDD